MKTEGKFIHQSIYLDGVYKFTIKQINCTTNVLQSPVAALRTTKFKDENILHSAHRVSFCANTSLGFYDRESVCSPRSANSVLNIVQVDISL